MAAVGRLVLALLGGVMGCTVTASTRGSAQQAPPSPEHSSDAPEPPRAETPAPGPERTGWRGATGAHFQGLGGTPGWRLSNAVAASRDGSTLVGFDEHMPGPVDSAVRWSDDIEALPDPDLDGVKHKVTARDVSPDGSVVVGVAYSEKDPARVVLWRGSEATVLDTPRPFENLEALGVSAAGRVVVGFGRAGYGCPLRRNCHQPFVAVNRRVRALDNQGAEVYGHATDVSDDGRVISGTVNRASGSMAVRWKDGVYEELGTLNGAPASMSNAISGNGEVIVGRSFPAAFRWEGGVLEDLGRVGIHDRCAAKAVSHDGSRIVGYCHGSTQTSAILFLWEKGRGMRDLRRILVDELHLDLEGWRISEVFGMSDDGRVIVGQGYNPSGQREGWVAVVPRAPN